MSNRVPRRRDLWASRHLKERRLENIERLKAGKGRVVPAGVNACFKPSSPQTKADLEDLHDDNMRERRANYRKDKRGPDGCENRGIARFAKWFDRSWKQQDRAWISKSIWPDGKTMTAGRRLNGPREAVA